LEINDFLRPEIVVQFPKLVWKLDHDFRYFSQSAENGLKQLKSWSNFQNFPSFSMDKKTWKLDHNFSYFGPIFCCTCAETATVYTEIFTGWHYRTPDRKGRPCD